MLALRANRTVSAEELIDGLWAERPPQSAAKNVQLHVSRLRKALGSDDCGASIVTHGRGYELKLPQEAVDAVRFEQLVERARREAEQGIADGAARGALELWRGAPLADVASEPFAGPEIRRLEELHLRALELSIDAELAAGRHGEVIGRLEALLAEHPLNERFYAQRMLALHRAGRRSEALDAYRQAHRTLSEEIGIEPGPELRRLQEQILAQDPALEAPVPTEELPPQLEGGSPLLAGRERELAWLRARWAESASSRPRIAFVSGPAGIGKTRLAAELAATLRRAGATVLYAGGSGGPDAAVHAIRRADESERPTLLVLDDADDASPAVLEAAAELAAKPQDSPLLIVALHQDERESPALAELARAAASRLALDRLGVEAVAEIAALYAPADGVAIPVERLIAESEGVPLRVHRAASAWAQGQAAEQLEGAVGKAVVDQSGLRTARAKVAGSVADLQVVRERTQLYAVSEPPDPSTPEVCPFRGLAPFEAAQAEYFFGRERLVAALVARLVGSALLAVFGPSGSGKSSLLRAGLLPALANGVLPGSERWRQVLIRPGAHPLAELGRALERLAPGQRENNDDPLAAALGSLAPDERLILAVDQFEELFTACRDEGERAGFAEALVSIADDPDQRAGVVLAIRADFYGRCADYRELSAQISANQVLVGPLTRDELRQAIELPAQRAGLRVEPALVSELIDDVADRPGGLPLLSTALLELWEARSGRTLRHASYVASGGVSGAVARLAERAYRGLSETQRERARAILLRLADAEQPTPVRRRVALASLEAERDEDAAGALAALTESRLVTVDEDTVEVAHEALLREWPRLRGWLEEDAEGRRLHQHLIQAAEEWEASGRDPAELYRGARLASALDWAAGHDAELNELERDFLDASNEVSEREAERQRRTNRRLRTLLAGVGVLLAAAIVAGVMALSERQGARSAATVADAERLGAQALSEERPDQALRLATAGVALDDSVATRASLLSTLLRRPAAIRVLTPTGDELPALALSPDGKTLAASDADGTVTLFDTDTYEVVGEHQAPATAFVIAFDPQGDSLAVAEDSVATGGTLEILDAATGRVRSSTSLAAGQGFAPLGIVIYAPDGRSLFVPYHRGHSLFLRRYDARRGTPLGKPVRVGAINQPPGVTPDGRLLVVADRGVKALDAETLRVIRRYPFRGDPGAVSPDGRTLAIDHPDGSLSLLDLASGRVRTLTGAGAGTPKAFSPDGRILSTAEDDGSVILWDVEEGVPIETLEGHRGVTETHAFSPDGRILYTAGNDGRLIVWDVAGNRRLGRPFPRGSGGWEHDYSPVFALSPDGRAVAVARLDGRVELIDAETLRRTASFKAFPGRSAVAIDYSADGRRLAVAGEGGGVGVWDAESGERVGVLLRAPRAPRPANPRTVGALAFGQGDLLAAAEVGGAVRIWDVGRRELLRSPLRLPASVYGLAFSPDGSQLAIPFGADADEGPNGVEILDVASGERVARLSPDGEVRSVAFSPDGGLLAGGMVDGRALLWASDGWGRVGGPLARQTASTLEVEFSPDGHTLATSHSDHSVALWDVASQEPIGPPLGKSWGEDIGVTARFTPGGAHLFVLSDPGEGRASDLGPAIRWEVDPELWLQRACAVAGGGLSPEQWEEVVPEQDYRPACPSG
ncbi:MAG: transcriptional activator domain [Geminicoccaceae bacterium]|jgi:WD40 repeat protein/DNA-binding SARP family transcriptional activator|nr:transcriptional activator domain [Geminicoccaceae bacterium]